MSVDATLAELLEHARRADERLARMEEWLAAPRGGGLEPLSAILAKSRPAANMILARDDRPPPRGTGGQLRRLGVVVGGRGELLFDRATVLQYLRARQAGRGRARLRAVGGP